MCPPTPSGAGATARYTALKMGNVAVSASAVSGSFALTGTLTIDKLDVNSVTNTAGTTFKRLNWAKAFDLDGDVALWKETQIEGLEYPAYT